MPAMKPPVGSDYLLRVAASFNHALHLTRPSRFGFNLVIIVGRVAQFGR